MLNKELELNVYYSSLFNLPVNEITTDSTMQNAATQKIECTSNFIIMPLSKDITGPIILVNEVAIEVIVPLYLSGVLDWITVKKFACAHTLPNDTTAYPKVTNTNELTFNIVKNPNAISKPIAIT